jgi:deoxyadenosine/deoxycytidine kinase
MSTTINGGENTMILFEGNIAAGKSEAGRRLSESGLFGFVQEPVGAWQKDFEENLLDLFYKDTNRWALTFQLAAFVTRAKTWTEVLALTDHKNVILERSIYCDRYVFAKNCYQSGLMKKTEWQLYCKLWDWLEGNWCADPDRIAYLRTPAEVCLERIEARGRAEENTIPIEYLRDLHVLHEEWLIGNPKTILIDGVQSEEGVVADIIDKLKEVGIDPTQ